MIFEIDKLSFRYRDSEPWVLSEVSLMIEDAETLTVLGRNGAGKSTLFACMLGLNKIQSGEIRLCGRELQKMSEREIASCVAFVPQSHSPSFDYTVFDFVLMGCASKVGLFSRPGRREERSAEEALKQMGIEHLAFRSFTELSGGERQQVTIARAIASEPKVILFDEPTAHLDFANQLKVLKIIKALSEKGYAIAITTHDPNHAILLGGKTAILDGKGGITVGGAKEIITEERLRSVYGTDLKLRYSEEFRRDICIYPNL